MKAINVDTNETVDVVPFGLFSPDFSSLYMVDANTGWGLHLDIFHDESDWEVDPDDPNGDRIGEVYSEDENEWEREMNEELAQYGLALGDEDRRLGGYWLEEL